MRIERTYTPARARRRLPDPGGTTSARRGKRCVVLLGAALLWTLCALADDSFGLLDWVGGDISGIVVLSLLRGFAPIIGSGLLIVLSAVLYCILLFSIEKVLAEEDPAWDTSKAMRKDRIAWNLSLPVGTRYLSLKEHSPPPAILLTA